MEEHLPSTSKVGYQREQSGERGGEKEMQTQGRGGREERGERERQRDRETQRDIDREAERKERVKRGEGKEAETEK